MSFYFHSSSLQFTPFVLNCAQFPLQLSGSRHPTWAGRRSGENTFSWSESTGNPRHDAISDAPDRLLVISATARGMIAPALDLLLTPSGCSGENIKQPPTAT